MKLRPAKSSHTDTLFPQRALVRSPPTPRDVGITPKAVGDVTPTYAYVAGASGGAVGRGYAPDAPRGKQKRTVACATVRKWPGGPGRQAVAMGVRRCLPCREGSGGRQDVGVAVRVAVAPLMRSVGVDVVRPAQLVVAGFVSCHHTHFSHP